MAFKLLIEVSGFPTGTLPVQIMLGQEVQIPKECKKDASALLGIPDEAKKTAPAPAKDILQQLREEGITLSEIPVTQEADWEAEDPAPVVWKKKANGTKNKFRKNTRRR
jgi:hypothetical protein